MEESSGAVSATKISTHSVYIFNMSEDVWPFIKAFSDADAKHREIEENADLGDRDIFSFCGEDNMLFIMPRPIGEAFWDYFTHLFGKKNFRVLVPAEHSGEICEDIQKDKALLNELITAANGQKRLTIRSYATSQQFLDLVRLLRDKGITVFTPEAPDEDNAWTVNFYGSKSGIRQLSQQSLAREPDFIMPEGVIVSGIIDASRIAAYKYIKEHGVVIKTNKGHSGAGVLLLREGDLPTDFTTCQKKILALLRKDEYWKFFPIIIESYISINQSVGGGSPNVEYRILKNGHVEFMFSGGMRVTKDGIFRGMEINNEVVSDQVVARMVDTGFYIAEQYRANGYCGFFDVDFVAAKNGQLYVTESNVRRTGGSHVHFVAEKFFGKDYMYLTYILSNNSYELDSNRTYEFTAMLQKLEPILFNKTTREGIVLISENMLSYKRLSYIIFGKNKKRAYEIESAMETLVRE